MFMYDKKIRWKSKKNIFFIHQSFSNTFLACILSCKFLKTLYFYISIDMIPINEKVSKEYKKCLLSVIGIYLKHDAGYSFNKAQCLF